MVCCQYICCEYIFHAVNIYFIYLPILCAVNNLFTANTLFAAYIQHTTAAKMRIQHTTKNGLLPIYLLRIYITFTCQYYVLSILYLLPIYYHQYIYISCTCQYFIFCQYFVICLSLTDAGHGVHRRAQQNVTVVCCCVCQEKKNCYTGVPHVSSKCLQ